MVSGGGDSRARVWGAVDGREELVLVGHTATLGGVAFSPDGRHLLTASDEMDTRLEGMHRGVSEFLTKPINKPELFARVRAQLHIVELGRQLEVVERNLHALRRDALPPRREE